MKIIRLVALGIGVFLVATTAAKAAMTGPGYLRCEYRTNPLGMDQPRPRLSWDLNDPSRGARQTARQIEAASTDALLLADKPDLWDSGRVASSEIFDVPYGGKAFSSGQRVWWRVREWDADGKASPWSEPAWWEAGILKPDDWHDAQWISSSQKVALKKSEFPQSIDPGSVGAWITDAGDQTSPNLLFQFDFTLPPKEIVDARLVFGTSQDGVRADVSFNKGRGDILPIFIASYAVTDLDVTTRLLIGAANRITLRARSSEAHPAITVGLRLTYADGTSQTFATNEQWKTGPAPEDAKDPDAWKRAEVGGAVKVLDQAATAAFHPLRSFFPEVFVPPLMRKSFEVKPGLVRARAYVCGIGYYEFYLNGHRQGDAVLQPAQTNYAQFPHLDVPAKYEDLQPSTTSDDKFSYYNVYDITHDLKPGSNGAGIYLGDGFYNQNMAWLPENYFAQGKPGAIGLIRLDYADGTTENVVTDSSWEWKAGPILRSNEYFGEIYDARHEIPDWSVAPFHDNAGWTPANLLPPISPHLTAQPIPPMRRIREIKPVKITELQPGAWLVDYGENITGWVHLKVTEPAGTTVRLRFTDWIWPDGHLDNTADLWPQVDLYTTKGGGPEEWEPRFTDHAFQYMEISGLHTAPTPEMLTVEVVHTDLEQAGQFACSNDLLNREQQVALRTFGDNIHGRIEDCPTRERCEWGHNVQMAEALMFNYQMAPLYIKYVDDFFSRLNVFGIPYEIGLGMRISRFGAGDVPSMNGPLEAADLLQAYYDDPDPGNRHYDAIKHFVLALQQRADHGIIRSPGHYGDHVAQEPREPRELASSFYYLYAAQIWETIAKRLGHDADAKQADTLAESIRQAIIANYYDATAKSFRSQWGDTLAIHFNVVPEDSVAIAADLNQRVHASDDRLMGGFLSYTHVADILSDYGYGHEAFLGMTNTKDPGFPWGVAQGYTTIFEIYAPHGSEEEQHVSHNHPNFGGVAQWFYKSVAGIQPDPASPAFRHFFLHPRQIEDLDWAQASYHAMTGWISSSWQKKDGRFFLQVTVPANATATTWLPTADTADILESGQPLTSSTGVRLVRQEKKESVCELAAGSYRFEVPMASK